MTFPETIQALKEGKKVTNADNQPGCYYYMRGEDIMFHHPQHQGDIKVKFLMMEHLLSDEWEIIKETASSKQ